MQYESAVEYILNIPKFTDKNDLNHTAGLLRKLGNPQDDLKVIHIAGTNGKGSVCACMASVMKESGQRCGMFTSPHLMRINERFRVDGTMISDEQFTECFDQVMQAVKEQMADGTAHPTFFEFIFLMAMVFFQKQEAEYVFLETGLGGRLDATNVVEHPALTVITSIGMDHTEILGDSIEKIAFEKAGIIKQDIPVIADGRNAEAYTVIQKRAEEMNASLTVLRDDMLDIVLEEKHIEFSIETDSQSYRQFEIGGIARYQAVNAALALLALERLDIRFGEDVLRRGIRNAFWAGRMEEIRPGVFLDGAHNREGIRELNNTLRTQRKPLYLLFACTAEKNYEEMIQMLCKGTKFEAVVITELNGPRKCSMEVLESVFRRYISADVIADDNIQSSLEKALQLKGNDGILFVAGSLYLIGDTMRYFKNGGLL